jgi:hypothetical protein
MKRQVWLEWRTRELMISADVNRDKKECWGQASREWDNVEIIDGMPKKIRLTVVDGIRALERWIGVDR